MTNYLTLPAGPELDMLIAQKVMGLHKDVSGGFDGSDHEAWFRENGGKVSDFAPPNYSTKISTAWEVVEKLSASWKFSLYTLGKSWVCNFYPIFGNESVAGEATAASAHLAICRAALVALESKGTT